MPKNRPPGRHGSTAGDPEAGPTPRINRRTALIAVLVVAALVGAVLVGAVLVGTTSGDPRPTGAEQAAPSTPEPATAVAPSSKAGSASPAPSARLSASVTHSAVTRSGAPAGQNRADCGASPVSCGFPDASRTGVPPGTRLTVLNGDQTITKAGTVIDGKDIRGCVQIEAPRVTIRRSKISCAGFYALGSFIESYSGGGLVVQDVEISCRQTGGTGIGSYGFTAIRVDISGCENGMDISSGVTVRDSYLHDPHSTAENHADGIQLSGGSNITISHNTIFMPASTSAIISNPDKNSDVLVSDNLLSGGAYTLYCPRDRSTGYRVIGNRFSTVAGPKGGQYGPWTGCAKTAEVTGNVWDATGKPLTAD